LLESNYGGKLVLQVQRELIAVDCSCHFSGLWWHLSESEEQQESVQKEAESDRSGHELWLFAAVSFSLLTWSTCSTPYITKTDY